MHVGRPDQERREEEGPAVWAAVEVLPERPVDQEDDRGDVGHVDERDRGPDRHGRVHRGSPGWRRWVTISGKSSSMTRTGTSQRRLDRPATRGSTSVEGDADQERPASAGQRSTRYSSLGVAAHVGSSAARWTRSARIRRSSRWSCRLGRAPRRRVERHRQQVEARLEPEILLDDRHLEVDRLLHPRSDRRRGRRARGSSRSSWSRVPPDRGRSR